MQTQPDHHQENLLLKQGGLIDEHRPAPQSVPGEDWLPTPYEAAGHLSTGHTSGSLPARRPQLELLFLESLLQFPTVSF